MCAIVYPFSFKLSNISVCANPSSALFFPQACVLLLSLILILALGTHYSAGLSDVFSRAAEHDRIEFFK